MRGKVLLWLLVGLGAALLALAAGGLLLDIPVSTGEVRILRVNVLVGLLILSATIDFALSVSSCATLGPTEPSGLCSAWRYRSAH
jgi:hypothetical protein